MNDISRMTIHIRNMTDGFDSVIEHRCSEIQNVYENDTENVVIIKLTNQDAWYLLYDRYADLESVELGIADEVGEVITEGLASAYIDYCPYCGIKLNNGEVNQAVDSC